MSSDKPMELGIPPQKADPAKRFLTDPKAVTAWLEDLPLANIGETARLVYRALADLTHLEVPDLPRVRVAEELREAVRFLGRNLLPRYVDAAFPLPTKTRKIALLNREIHGELATAYKIVLLHQSELPAPKLDRKLVALAAARALRYLQAVSLHSALIYEPPPPGTWREIHEIFEFIRRLGLDEVAVGDGVEPQPGSATPRDLYLRALLFSLVPPYRMRQRDMLSLADLLPAWAPLARLLPLSEARASSASVVVSTAADEPPSYRAANGKEPAAATYALITHEIGQVLRRMIEGSTAEPTQSLGALKASKSLLRQLIQAWGAGPTRRFVRTRLNFDLDLVIGMDNVHALLYSLRNRQDSDDQAVTPEPVEEDSVLEELTAFTASIRMDSEPSTLDMSLAEDDSIFFFAQAPRADTPPRVESAPAPTAAAKALPAEPPPTFHLRTINESAGGYCLSWAGRDVPQIKIGEIVGVRSARHSDQFGVGVVRWMKNEHHSGAQIGVEMLSPASDAIELRPPDSATGSGYRALLLPAHQHSEEAETILAPPLTYRSGQVLLINERPGETQIRLGEISEASAAFARFYFERLAGEPADAEPGPGFESLWKSL